MARRKKAAGASKGASKAKGQKKSNGVVTRAVQANDSEESAHSQDNNDIEVAELQIPKFVEETDLDDTATTISITEISCLPSQASPIDIVHKKFGKLRCTVETDSGNNDESMEYQSTPPVSVSEEGVDNELEGIGLSGEVWEEEVVEETVICGEMELEVEVEVEEEASLGSNQIDTELSFQTKESDGCQLYGDVPLKTTTSKNYMTSKYSTRSAQQNISQDPKTEVGMQYDGTTSESEVNSRDDDSQDSNKMSGSDCDPVKQSSSKSTEPPSQRNKLFLEDIETDSIGNINVKEGRRCLRSSTSKTRDQLIVESVSKSVSVEEVIQPAVEMKEVVPVEDVIESTSSLTTNSPCELLTQVQTLEVIHEMFEESKEEVDLVEVDEESISEAGLPTALKTAEDQAPAFRSRSGSTDTTGSESSSNCSNNIRRSSRIRSISIIKQRTRNRFEAISISSEETKAVESRDSSDNNSGTETQSDRENLTMKMPVPMSVQSVSAAPGGKPLDINFKPVKVKSRWRRSSELEMVGNRSSDSDVAATPPTPSHSPHLFAPRTPSMSPRPTVVLSNPATTSPILATVPTTDIPNPGEVTPKRDIRSEKKIKEDKEMEERLRQFVHLKENDYLTDRSSSKEFRGMICDCFLTKDEVARGEQGCGEDCLNRLLMIECGSRCTLGDRCTNKHFQKQEYSRCEVFKTEKKGFGLRATADLSSGSFLMEYVGEVVNPKEFRRRAKEYSKDKNRHYYFMALKSDSIIDATMKGNISRFINHSCDPNAETQKWTVNGELRIGFFTTRSLAAWEEITFDYQFQRYGKEAQRCHCESALCRGWIGEDPEKEKEKEEIKEKKDRDTKKKREEKRQVEVEPEEEDSDEIDATLEEDIEKLCASGLKNRTQTLTLCRLMVRGQDSQSRVQLLQLIQRGEPACLRLFLDYHGLRLIWKWMSDADGAPNNLEFRTEILRTISKLPILNKTVLQDSKVLSFVEKWVIPVSTSDVDAEQMKQEQLPEGVADDPDKNKVAAKLVDQEKSVNAKDAVTVANVRVFTDLAISLLAEWSNLKEVFRIPKKERIEQMKEHEREADRGYKEYLDKEDNRTNKQSYDRHWRQRSAENDKTRERKKLLSDVEKVRKSRFEDRCIVQLPGLSKEERRQLFAEKVAKEEEEERQRKLVEEEDERQRKHQENHWRVHEEQCQALGVDPNRMAFDWDTGCMAIFDPSTGNWMQYPPGQDQPVVISDGGVPQMYDPNNAIPHTPYDANNPGPYDANNPVLPGPYDANNPILPSPYDPNHPMNSQFPPYDTSQHMNPQFNPNNSHFNPGHPMNSQYDQNNPMHPQFNSNMNPQFNPNAQFNPQFNHMDQYNPNNQMNAQFNPGHSKYDPNNTMYNQNHMNPQFNPNQSPYMNPQYDPNHPANIQFNPNNPESPHLSNIVQGNHPGYDPNVMHHNQPPLPYEEPIHFTPPLPSNPCLITIPLIPSPPPKEVTIQTEEEFGPLSPDSIQIVLPDKWKMAKDHRGYTYYYHTDLREPHWNPPWELVESHVVSGSEDSEEEEEEGEEAEEGGDSPGDEEEEEVEGEDVKDDLEDYDQSELVDDEEPEEFVEDEEVLDDGEYNRDEVVLETEELDDSEHMMLDPSTSQLDDGTGVEETNSNGEEDLFESGISEFEKEEISNEPDQTPNQELEQMNLEDVKDVKRLIDVPSEEGKKKERREGLVQERIISPRREEDRPPKKNYRIIKEKLRRKKDEARKARSKKKRRERSESKSRLSRPLNSIALSEGTDASTEARKIKDHFRLQMAGAIVQYLNPFRKSDCTQGRITNTEDFKHLARKLTHFVMLKELKHCRNVDDLVCNDSVKHKARDFIRKYMSKFGTLYQRPIDDD